MLSICLRLRSTHFDFQGTQLRFLAPLVIEPQLSEDKAFITVQNSTLGVDVFAGTVSDLVDELMESLAMVWKNYALANDAELSPKALALKYRLLASVEEVV